MSFLDEQRSRVALSRFGSRISIFDLGAPKGDGVVLTPSATIEGKPGLGLPAARTVFNNDATAGSEDGKLAFLRLPSEASPHYLSVNPHQTVRRKRSLHHASPLRPPAPPTDPPMPSALRRLPVVVLSSFALSAIVGVGCKAPPPPPPPVVTIDLAAINAVVPVAWKQKIVFAQRELTAKSMSGDVTYTLAAPTAWTADSMQLPGSVSVHPPYGLDSGFNNFTGLKIGSSCEGACVPKDWAAVAAKGFSKFGEGAEERVVRDEKKATSHLRITETKDTTYLEYAFWYPGSSRYFKCNATLGVSQMPDTVDPRPAMAAFEKACQSVNVTLPEPKK